MKALTVRQPQASLIAIRAKQFETRSWRCPEWLASAPGRDEWVALHAGARWSRLQRDLLLREPFGTALGPHFDLAADRPLPLGAIIALVKFYACVPAEDLVGRLSADELAFGDFSAGRFAWRIGEVRELEEPIPALGLLGFWNVPAEVLLEIESQLGERVA